jgi:type I restriction enzyme, S subunit
MSSSWLLSTLGDVADVLSGGTPTTSVPEYWGGEIVWITPSEVVAQEGRIIESSERTITPEGLAGSSAKMLPVGAVLLTSRATIGATALVGRPLCTNQGFASLVPGERALPRFLMYWCQAHTAEFTSRAGGNTFKEISRKKVAAIPISLPPLDTQSRIVDLITSVDSYIDALRVQVDAARIARTSLVHELLGSEALTGELLPLEECAEILDRLRRPINSEERARRQGDVPYYGANGRTGWIDEPLFDEELVLLGEDAIDFLDPLASKAYRIEGPSWVNNHAHVLRPRSDTVLATFLTESLNLVDYSQFVSFGTRSKLTQKSMKRIAITVPPVAEQQRFVDLVSSLDSFGITVDASVESATHLRTALLSDLLSGNHEIPESYDALLEAS